MLKIPDYVSDFMKVFKNKGFQIYLVGGAVRDLIIRKEIVWDFADFTTNARPQEIVNLFSKTFYENQFGTVGVEWKDNPTSSLDELGTTLGASKKRVFEVTTFRKESDYKDKRHPSYMEWADTIEEDLGRRDFTINAVAYDGKNIIDPYNGQGDIQKKLIKSVGDPEKRFSEDALRLMRAIRFSSQLGFLIEDKTRESIKKNAKLIKNISAERIRDELFKIIASDNPAEGILFLRSTNIMDCILPEILECFDIPQKSPKRHHVYDVGTHLVMSLKHCPSKDTITRFAALLHDIGKAKTFRKDPKTKLITFYNHEIVGERISEKIADRFKLSRLDKKKLITLVRQHQFTVSEEQSDKAIRRFIRNVGIGLINDILDLRTGDRLGGGARETSWRLELFKKRLQDVQKEPFSLSDLKINGNEVIKTLNLKPGKEIGKILNNLFDDVVAGKIKNNKKALLKKLKSF
ncbi:MAG: CCA tRNA nucleotidyltransferase [bacterium]